MFLPYSVCTPVLVLVLGHQVEWIFVEAPRLTSLEPGPKTALQMVALSGLYAHPSASVFTVSVGHQMKSREGSFPTIFPQSFSKVNI